MAQQEVQMEGYDGHVSVVDEENPYNSSSSCLRHPMTIITSFQQHFGPQLIRKVVAEAVATYILVFVTCGAAALSASDESKIPKLGASIAGGLIVTVMIYAVGHISGAHMNPAVTLGFASVQHFPWNQVPFYVAAQFTGAICSSFTLKVLLHPNIQRIGTTSPSGTKIQALIMEIVVTFVMVLVANAVANDSKAAGELAGVAVGSSVCITSILAGPISGGSMNPARSIGPALASAYYKGIWVYIVGPVTGSLLASFTYNYIRLSDQLPVVNATSPDHSSPFKQRRNTT